MLWHPALGILPASHGSGPRRRFQRAARPVCHVYTAGVWGYKEISNVFIQQCICRSGKEELSVQPLIQYLEIKVRGARQIRYRSSPGE